LITQQIFVSAVQVSSSIEVAGQVVVIHVASYCACLLVMLVLALVLVGTLVLLLKSLNCIDGRRLLWHCLVDPAVGVGVLVVTSLVIILVLVLVAILVAIPNSVVAQWRTIASMPRAHLSVLQVSNQIALGKSCPGQEERHESHCIEGEQACCLPPILWGWHWGSEGEGEKEEETEGFQQPHRVSEVCARVDELNR